MSEGALVMVTNDHQSLLDAKGAHYLAILWWLERTDGSDLRFTDHNTQITFENNTYTPVGGVSASAVEKQTGLQEQNFELLGVLDSTAITHDDLRAGLYNHAHIREYLVDWRYPWAGAITSREYWIREIRFSGERWEAQVAGLTTFLQPKICRVYSKTCPYTLGDTKCGVSLTGGNLVSGAGVDAIVEQRRIFETDLAKDPDWGTFGVLTWTAGDNNGLSYEVKQHWKEDGRIELFLPTAYDIDTSDTFDITAGCDKTTKACKSFSNLTNFGGFPFIPGTDRMLQTPNAKSS